MLRVGVGVGVRVVPPCVRALLGCLMWGGLVRVGDGGQGARPDDGGCGGVGQLHGAAHDDEQVGGHVAGGQDLHLCGRGG